jgi:peptide/nickel transport system permease protein
MRFTFRRILGRLFAGLGVLWGAATLTFVVINVSGGDPAMEILGGVNAMPTPAILAQVRADYHLDEPLYRQYLLYLGRLARGDLGESYRLRIPVTHAIGQQLGATLELAFWAASFALPVSILVATFTARRKRWIRGLSSGLELVGSSVPGFVIGIILLLIFSFRLHWLPASGQSSWKSLVLPTLTLSIPMIGVLTQVLRNELEEILEQPFIITARARGLSETGVRLGHALRHALIPLVTLSGTFIGMLLGGAVIAESLFARQGVGRLMADATMAKDVPLVLGITLLSAATYVVVNLIVDLVNTAARPRTRAI